MKKRIIALLCLLVMAVSLMASGCQEKVVAYERGTPVPYYSVKWRGLDEDEFYISGFIGPQDFYAGIGYRLPSLITDEAYAKLAEAGINNIEDQRFDVESEVASRALPLAAKYGITYTLPCDSILDTDFTGVNDRPEDVHIGTQEEITAKMEELMAKYENLNGFHLRDEPTSNCFPYLNESVEKVEAAREELGLEGVHGYINSFPGVGWNQLSNGTDPEMNWDKYLRGICDTGIDFLSWDAYPFTNVPGEIQSTWLNGLGTVKRMANEYKIPCYIWIQCGGGPVMFSTSHRVVNEGEMNWNIGSALCFGYTGIGYYTLVTPPEGATADEEYVNDDSILNKYGSKTPFFYYAKKINAQIQAMAPVLLHSAWEGIMIDNLTSPNVYTGPEILESYRCFKGWSGDSALIGCFDYEGTVALVVMNNSIENHHAVVTLKFDNNYAYEVTQRTQTDTITGKEFSLHLEAGEFALVVVQ